MSIKTAPARETHRERQYVQEDITDHGGQLARAVLVGRDGPGRADAVTAAEIDVPLVDAATSEMSAELGVDVEVREVIGAARRGLDTSLAGRHPKVTR